ncbi:MAG: hypothetical protein E7580_03420 [Ruminococcaceae bacterium]|nr:hypothetical protein [Oscillospiraceae bacterium]
MSRIYKLAFGSLAVNIAFSGYNIVIGCVTHSWWLLTVGTYYAVLSVVRYTVLRSKKESTAFIKQFTGILLMVMTLPLVGTVVLATVQDRGTVYHEIVMITIAVYAFTKITLASVNLAKSRRSASLKVKTLRNISFADAFVSIFSLQRSMLVSFGEMAENTIRIMNIATGSVVCIIIFFLGVNLLRKVDSQLF